MAVGVALVFGVAACSDSLTSPAAEETPSASSSTPTQRSGDGPYVVVEDPPKLKGGLAALQEEITYPKLARKAGIEGRVFVKFVVGTDGAVQNPTVTRGVHKLLNEEALRAVKKITFEPGRQRGKPVRVQMSLPVTFQLPDSTTTESDTGISPDASSETSSQIEDRVQNAFRSVQYPDLLRKAGVEGRVVVTFTIGSSGQIQDPRVAESAHEALDTAALQVVQNLTFDGTGQSTDVTLHITFSRSNEEGAEIRFSVNAR
jgi:TonB family protein